MFSHVRVSILDIILANNTYDELHSSICSSYMYIGKLKRINVSNFLILNWNWDIFFANRILRQIVFFIAFFFWIWLRFSIFFKNAWSYCFSMLTVWAFLWSRAISFNLTEQELSSRAFYHFLCDEIWSKVHDFCRKMLCYWHECALCQAFRFQTYFICPDNSSWTV